MTASHHLLSTECAQAKTDDAPSLQELEVVLDATPKEHVISFLKQAPPCVELLRDSEAPKTNVGEEPKPNMSVIETGNLKDKDTAEAKW